MNLASDGVDGKALEIDPAIYPLTTGIVLGTIEDVVVPVVHGEIGTLYAFVAIDKRKKHLYRERPQRLTAHRPDDQLRR
jgi:hypothetical protein